MSYAHNVFIHKMISKYGYAIIGATDINQAFDFTNRNIMIYNENKIGIKGKNIRLYKNELKKSKARIAYNNTHSDELKVVKGAPQGGTGSGPAFNLYTTP
eukprot:183928_1